MNKFTVDISLVKYINSGQKIVELRLGKPDILKIKNGDVLELTSINKDQVVVGQIKITQVLYFETLEEAFGSISYRDIIPGVPTVSEAIDYYRRIISADDEYEYGVAALFFEQLM